MDFDFSRPIENVELARDLAVILETLDGEDWRDRARLHVAGLPRDLTAWQTRDHTEQSPRCLKVDVQQGTLFLIQGVKRAPTALRLMQAYGLRPSQNRPAGLNAQVHRGTEELFNALIPNDEALRPNILIAGHSYGGAVAQALASAIKWIYPSRNTRVITFGAPRAGTLHWAQENRTLQHVRFWNHDDPIRMICPRRAEARGAHAVLTGHTSSYWQDHDHVGQAVGITTDGGLFRSSTLEAQDTISEINVIGWATGVLQQPVTAHSIAEYARRLRGSVSQGMTIGHLRPGTVIRERAGGPPIPQPQMQDVPEVVAAVQAVAVAAQAVREVPMPHVFTAENHHGEWGVFRGVELVTFARTATRARAIARVANGIYRDMQARGEVDEIALQRVVASML